MQPIKSSKTAAPIHVITGTTATGKTALGLRLAQALDGEIISADSRQIYKELTIGSAKPTIDELAQVPHHFVNELNLGEPYSAGSFAEQASVRIDEVLARGHVPVVVGGSTLYLHALVHGLSPTAPSDPDVRTNIEKRLEELGKDALYKELSRIDPQSASTMDPTKTSRLVRALEVFELTGTPLSKFHGQPVPSPHEFCVTVLTLERPTLYQRIEQRVDRMLEEGLMEENRQIRDLHLDRTLPALKSIGYQEPLAYLDGHRSWSDMVELIKRNSRRYAKRQLTWLRRYETYRRIYAQSPTDELLETILASPQP
ncbi:MAG: tRNA (adenosine(37)-N6)-dimethylallyltransferase MiaA [Rhodothermaceae bacterium]|nr:tRNA (adenosine(37)-N6)-dimethylallyltransferase MiaA [Rhodothermaceae bacterium]MXW33353.1 tRNA (adenosine(37)-N6)-dimethylallyltransferase MiaA [Rhodothermaceae bacterium]MYC05180.1 tRNA (adenosine(37)-N6)-dimethylallyltransferase MiaA [Rhodothermaceae bacterium]MYE63787.1 tRNA (adenosine(37)-N6)-dimethylallyltransferase MiaA [Rhodothermaceae bacterium]MYI17977.1 tRNA (adenosine(37)-N6)-dimethylallyltransferase MiaA [Rhodothermaceae bacterium]